jgi:hypothetical protein
MVILRHKPQDERWRKEIVVQIRSGVRIGKDARQTSVRAPSEGGTKYRSNETRSFASFSESPLRMAALTPAHNSCEKAQSRIEP